MLTDINMITTSSNLSWKICSVESRIFTHTNLYHLTKSKTQLSKKDRQDFKKFCFEIINNIKIIESTNLYYGILYKNLNDIQKLKYDYIDLIKKIYKHYKLNNINNNEYNQLINEIKNINYLDNIN